MNNLTEAIEEKVKEFEEKFADPDWLKNQTSERHMLIASRKDIKDFLRTALLSIAQQVRQTTLKDAIENIKRVQADPFKDSDDTIYGYGLCKVDVLKILTDEIAAEHTGERGKTSGLTSAYNRLELLGKDVV